MISTISVSYGALTYEEHNAQEDAQIKERVEECRNIKQYYLPQLSKYRRYSIECYKNYFLFNGSSQESKYNPNKYAKGSKIKVASYNVWNLGSSQTRFKDLDVTAQMMNQWDVVSAVEVLPLLADDAKNNEKVLKLLKEDPKNKEVQNLFRAPQYLKLLEALRKYDSSWALIVAPRESSRAGTAEMGAYYFRATKVKLRRNAYCEYVRGTGNYGDRKSVV